VIEDERLEHAQDILGHDFERLELLEQALMHASITDARVESNERLEFLGDVVLGLVVCEHLFCNYEDLLEGELTKIKSSVVSRKVCAEVAAARGLDEFIVLGKGLSNRSNLPPSVLAAVYEAVIGAIFLDGGLDAARAFVLQDMGRRITLAARTGHQHNFKSVLQQTAQQEFDVTPQYLLLDEKGPDHAKCFEVCVGIGSRRFPSAWGPSKKQAEQQAALEALFELGWAEQIEDDEIQIVDLDDFEDDYELVAGDDDPPAGPDIGADGRP